MERADGPATVLAIGTANPPNVFYQHDFPDFYFNITNSNHMTQLKQKFRRICENAEIKKRHTCLNEEILKANPSMCAYSENSLDVRQDMAVVEVPKLGTEAAQKAIKEWGQATSKITHLVFCTSTGVSMPGADLALTKLLGLRPSVKRHMMYQLGCYAGGTAMRVAKDVAENNKGARVLVVCSELRMVAFRGSSEANVGNLVGQAIFGDGAAAVIVGSDPIPEVERPLYEIHWAGSCILPDSERAIEVRLKEVGAVCNLMPEVPGIISSNIEEVLRDAFESFFTHYFARGGTDDTSGVSSVPISFNDMFWMVHPGGRAILDAIEKRLQLKADKLEVTRHVLSEYGNMASASVLFAMDEMRKRSVEQHMSSTGEGCEWGMLLGIGPGLTMETVILKGLQVTDITPNNHA